MNELQKLMYNEGERLVPYVSHNEDELIRHRSSYAFFHSVIHCDLQCQQPENNETSIIDLGFGTGYGCAILSGLPQSRVMGVDIEAECEVFAQQYYPRSNVEYIIEDLSVFIPTMSPVDYAVSRGVLEHIHDGLNLIKDIKFKKRVMIDVPYDEAGGNQHHLLTGIREDTFASFENCEIFFEDLQGTIYDTSCRPERPNMIMIVLSDPGLPKVGNLLKFPMAPIKSKQLEIAGQKNLVGKQYYYTQPEELLSAVKQMVKETEVVADIGSGIMPMNYFRPKLHFLVEPWKEYTDILSYRHATDKSIIILRMKALDALRAFADNSLDSIFLLDVIEHMDKNEGLEVVKQSERVAREQIVIFTPLGFMKQHIQENKKDGWGLSGHAFQEHLSGWIPGDFSSAWSCYICNEFHHVDHANLPLEQPFGAFFAVRNLEKENLKAPEYNMDIRRPLPAEVALHCLQTEYHALLKENQQLKKKLVNRISARVRRFFRKDLSVLSG
jgi:hypothetical protein